MELTIRPFTPHDYEGMVAVDHAVYSEYPSSLEELRHRDAHRDPALFFCRLVAERNHEIVGVGATGHFTDMFHPRKFWIELMVQPAQQRHGIGTALYQHCLDTLAQFDPLVLRSHTRQDWTNSVEFLTHRGFAEEMRAWESRLDLATFDPTPYADAEARVRAQGIEIKSLRELEADPERDRKLYELENELNKDVPAPDQVTDISYTYFVENRLNNPDLLPDGFFVALDRGTYVGMSALWANHNSSDLFTGLTGVKRSYRRRGIALAMKLRGIAYAQAQGCPTIRTWNESNNRPMLSINEMLGYVKQPAWITFANVLKREETAI